MSDNSFITDKNNFIDGMVSVIMPVYNGEKFIATAMESVLSQSYRNLELIVYNDASGDSTGDIVKSIADTDDRVKSMAGKANCGVAVARNRAILEARGSYIAFLDADDIWNKDKLDIQIDFMEKNECALCYSSYMFIDENQNIRRKKKAKIKPKAGYDSLLKDNYIGMLTVVIDRKKIPEINFKTSRHEDLILWIELAKQKHKMLGIQEPLASYRVQSGSLSGNKLKAAKWRWEIYRTDQGFGIFRSLWFMVNYTINSVIKRI